MTRVLVANPYVFNKRGSAFAGWLDRTGFDVALLNEMRLLHDDVRRLGHLASGEVGDARNNVVLTREPHTGERVVKLCDGVEGSKVWKDRSYVRVVLDGVAWYALHANAVIQDPAGHWRDNAGARRWQDAVVKIARAIRQDLDAGLEVVFGGDLNWRHGKPEGWVVGSSPEWLCQRLGLSFVTTQVMWLAHSKGIRLDRWQRLPTPPGADGHPVIVADLTRLPKAKTPVKFDPPAPPYAGPPAHHSGSSNKPIRRVVIHSTVSPCEPGGARNIAAYFRSARAGGSAHYVVDPAETYQAAYDSVVCHHAPPNEHTLGIEMCDVPGPVPDDKPGSARWKAARRSWRWAKPNQRKMLDRTARLTAELCLAYRVPLNFLTVAELRRDGEEGARGITTHANTSQAYHESTHWDPGFWPRRRFMRLVRKHAAELRAATR